MRTEMSDRLEQAADAATLTIADAPIGAVVRMLRHMDPDGAWPDTDVELRQHACAIARDGIFGDGPEACAVLATVLLENASAERHKAIADETDHEGTDLDVAIGWVAAGLEGGALTPELALLYVIGGREWAEARVPAFHPHGPDGGLGRPDARDAVADDEREG